MGTHEPGLADCDGDPSGAAHESRPCSWRIRCRGFQAHLAAAAEDAERYIQVVKLPAARRRTSGVARTAEPIGMEYAAFTRLCDAAAVLHAEESPGEEGHEDTTESTGPLSGARMASEGQELAHLAGEESEPKKSLTPAARKRRRAKAKWRAFTALADPFTAALRETMTANGLTYRASSRRLVLPGEVYARDNREKMRRTIYAGGLQGSDVGLIRLAFKTQTGTVDAFLSEDVRKFQKAMGRKDYMKMDPQPAAEGWYRSVIREADAERLVLLADALGLLLAEGIMELPGSFAG